MSQYISQTFDALGYYGIGSSGIAFNSASLYKGFAFTAPWAKTINSCRVYCTSITGTPTNGLKFGVYEQTSRFASTPTISNLVLSSGVTPTGASWIDITGFSQALTKNKVYHLLISNAAATPASNYFTLPYVYTNGPLFMSSASGNGTGISGFSAGNCPAMRIGFDDGTYYGFPISGLAGSSTYAVYSGRKVGEYFVTPTKLSAIGIYFPSNITVNGSPTGYPQLEYFTGDGSKSLVETVGTIYGATPGLAGNATYYTTFKAYFSSTQSIPAGTQGNIVLSETTQSDSSSNSFLPPVMDWDSNANSLALLPFSNKLVYYDGSTWTSTSNSHIGGPCGFILENGNEFPASGGGSTYVLPNKLSGIGG